jgi:hypothetical protein
MYSSISKGTTLLIFSVFNCLMSSVKAEDNTALSTKIAFSVQPQQCVTLRQGRDCFANITIQWQKSTEQALCLYQIKTKKSDTQKQLICWPKSNNGQTSVSFESSDNLTYQLRTLKDKELVAEAEIIVSWVHKNTIKRRRWRLF